MARAFSQYVALRRVILISASVAVFICVISFVYFSIHERRLVIAAAGEEYQRLAQALNLHLNTTFDFSAYLLATLDARIKDFPAGYDTNPAELHRVMKRSLRSAIDVGVLSAAKIFIVDRHGSQLADTAHLYPESINVADRAYFRWHRQSGQPVTRLSAVRQGDESGTSGVLITRRLEFANGSFAGVLGLVIDTGYFEGVYSALSMNPQVVISLVERNGDPLFQFQSYITPSLTTAPVWQRVPAAVKALWSSGGGVWSRFSFPGDQQERLVGYQANRTYGYIAIVSAPMDRVLARWEQSLVGYLFSILLALLMLLLLARLGLKQVGQIERQNYLSLHDPLTGLANRRLFERHLTEEWQRAARNRHCLALLYVDVDYFKPFNDHYGHQLGDECLRQISAALEHQVRRAGELVARIGGEEIVCLLPETDLEQALSRAESIRQAVESMAIAHAAAPRRDVITVSIGVTSRVPEPDLSPSLLVREADQALYRAKAEGRNCVRS